MELSAEAWFKLTEEEFDNITINGSIWPFTNVSEEEFLYFYHKLHTTQIRGGDLVLHVYASLLGAIGTAFTVLLIITLYRKAIIEKSGFYRAMMLIAVLNLTFCFFDMIYNMCYRYFKVYGYTDYIAMWIMIGFRGLVYCFSLASDMCTLALTLERYIAVTKPQLHKGIKNQSHIIQPMAGLIITLLALTRVRYSLEKTVIIKGSRYYYNSSDLASTSFVIGLAMFGDAILPVLLLFSMGIFSILFLVSVIKRRKKKLKQNQQKALAPGNGGNQGPSDSGTYAVSSRGQIAPQPPASPAIAWLHKKQLILPKKEATQKPVKNGLKSMVTLTLALDGLFLLNQLGYCVYLVCQQLNRVTIFYHSSYDEIAYYVDVWRLAIISDTICVLCELLSHVFNFPLYLALSRSTRSEFLKVIGKIL